MSEAGDEPLGIYLHIPWCPSRCLYCDFNTYTGAPETLVARYQLALLREIRVTGRAMGRPRARTVFIGGGTPTTLSPARLGALVEEIADAFDLTPDAEVTCEANPGTVSEGSLHCLRGVGINRISFGVQSLDNRTLALLGRAHDAEQARQAVAAARRAGFDNLSLDLIFALPHQSMTDWRHTLDAALALEPDHLSLYALMIEPATPLARAIRRGHLPRPDDDLTADMFDHAVARLDLAGFAQYELANWTRAGDEAPWQNPARAAAHNLIYWRGHDYLGLGAGAHGYTAGIRGANRRRPVDYIRAVEQSDTPGAAADPRSREQVDGAAARLESVMLGLRLTREGLPDPRFRARHGLSLADAFPDAIAAGLGAGGLEWVAAPDGDHLRLTPAGRFLADHFLVAFAP